jgi:hypothetical protein
MAKLEIYAIAALVLIAAITAAYLKGRADEHTLLSGQAAQQLLAATQKTEAINGQLTQQSAAHAATLAKLNSDHAAQLASALAAVKPVIVRIPATGSAVVPDAATRASGQPGPGTASGVPASLDIATAELVFAGKYQVCRDALDTYIEFYADVLKRVNIQRP